jgi:hypothetical protein
MSRCPGMPWRPAHPEDGEVRPWPRVSGASAARRLLAALPYVTLGSWSSLGPRDVAWRTPRVRRCQQCGAAYCSGAIPIRRKRSIAAHAPPCCGNGRGWRPSSGSGASARGRNGCAGSGRGSASWAVLCPAAATSTKAGHPGSSPVPPGDLALDRGSRPGPGDPSFRFTTPLLARSAGRWPWRRWFCCTSIPCGGVGAGRAPQPGEHVGSQGSRERAGALPGMGARGRHRIRGGQHGTGRHV